MFKSRKGFSLVEMAVVLIIFGLVMASASSILTLFVNKGGAERTRKMIEANKNVLYSIAASDGKYETDTENSLTYPTDAYGKDFNVILDTTLYKFDDGTEDKTGLDYSPICGTNSTIMSVRVCTSAACGTSNLVTDVAFVIASGSVNKNIQTEIDGTSNEVTVYYPGTDADDYTDDMDRSEEYDDIVDWVTLPELRAKAGCDPLKLDFLNTTMPSIKDGESYSYVIFPKDGIPYEGSDTDIEDYTFTLDSVDEDTSDTAEPDLLDSLEITVVSGDGDTILTSVGDSGRGTKLKFSTNSADLDDNDSYYGVEITITDDSSTPQEGASNNSVTRVLYIPVEK